MKINKKEYEMGGMMDYSKLASALKKYADGGEITPEEMAIRDQIAASGTASAAIPTEEDLRLAYKQTFKDAQDGMPFEDFLSRGVDDGDLNKLKSAAMALAEKRAQAARGGSQDARATQQKQIVAGTVIGSSYRPGSAQAEVDANESVSGAVDAETMKMLKSLGLR